MQIIYSSRFKKELLQILKFIKKDSKTRANSFSNSLKSKIEQIYMNPYAYRKRVSSEDFNLRELIFKGYTIPFLIDKQNNKIIVLGVFNQNLWNEN